MTDGELVVVLTTVPDTAAAEALAQALLAERLIACATALPGARSFYWWEGRLETADEIQLLLKTTSTRLPALLRRLPELHPYQVPELLALPVPLAAEPYARWAAAVVANALEDPAAG